MRGIGNGQKIKVLIIPEVKELMHRELAIINAGRDAAAAAVERRTLEDICAWLVVNSARSEKTQWSMLCLQNVSNVYRKNAYSTLLARCEHWTSDREAEQRAFESQVSHRWMLQHGGGM